MRILLLVSMRWLGFCQSKEMSVIEILCNSLILNFCSVKGCREPADFARSLSWHNIENVIIHPS